MAVADPTLESLKSLDDPGRYFEVKSVPVFCAHRRKVKKKDGEEQEIVVTDERLRDIVANVRREERENGVVPGLYLGHRNPDPDFPEVKQPPRVGFARNWRVGKWGPKRKTAILADFLYDRSRWDEAKDFPFRSAEFYDASDEISGVALLRRDPQLSLGLLTFARTGEPTLYEADEPPGDPAKPPGDPDKLPPEKPEPDEDEQFYQRFAKCMERFMAAAGAAGPGSAQLPPPLKKDAGLDAGDKGDLDRFHRTAEGIHYRRLKGELDETQREVQRLRKDRDAEAAAYARNEAALIVETLDRKDVLIKDPEALLAKFLALPTRQARLDYQREIEESWARAPTGRGYLPTGEPEGSANYARSGGSRGDPDSPAAKMTEAEEVVRYMRAEGEPDYDRAREKVREKKAAK